MAQKPPEIITFSLMENALDFLHSAVASVKSEKADAKRLKYGLLHLCDGIELLLKCRLDKEHWTLVLAEIDKVSAKDIESGDFKSVAWQEAINRVEKFADHPFDQDDKSLLDHLRKLRNRIQHFDLNIKQDECNALLAKGLHFATEFIEAELPDDGLEIDLNEIRKNLTEFQEFVDIRMKAIEDSIKEVKKYGDLIVCHRCRQETLHADGDNAECLFCGYKEEGETAASEWMDEFGGFRRPEDEMFDPSVDQCPECAKTAFVEVGKYVTSQDPSLFFCFCCGTSGHFDRCSDCNQYFQPDDDMSICDDCWQDKINKD